MGIFDRMFGKKRREPEPGSKEAKERADRLIHQMMGISGRAELSTRGHPICPSCGQEFPIPAKTIREQSDGIPALMCPSCKSGFTL